MKQKRIYSKCREMEMGEETVQKTEIDIEVGRDRQTEVPENESTCK